MGKMTEQELIRLAGIREDYGNSTPGMWYAVDKGNTVPSHSVMRYAIGEKAVNIASGISPKTGNAAFIVNAHGAIPFLLSLIDRLAQEPDFSGVDANRCEHQSDRCPHQYDLGVLMCCINHQGCADRQRKHMDAPARAEGEGGNG